MIVKMLLANKSEHKEIIAVKPDDTLLDAAVILKNHRIGAVIVKSNDDSFVGILSERDIVRAIASSDHKVMARMVADYMTKEVFTCSLEHSVDEIMEQMTKRRFRHLPVVADGKLIGVISIGDAVKAKIHMVENEIEHMRNYIVSG